MALCGRPPHTVVHRRRVRVMNKDSIHLHIGFFLMYGAEKIPKYPSYSITTCLIKLSNKQHVCLLLSAKMWWFISSTVFQLLCFSPFCVVFGAALFSFFSPGLWLWRHPISAEWVWEYHHCAAAPCAGKRGSCQVQLIHCSLSQLHSFIHCSSALWYLYLQSNRALVVLQACCIANNVQCMKKLKRFSVKIFPDV